MTVTFDSSWGSPNANAYTDINAANVALEDYCLESVRKPWTDASTPDRLSAIRMATRQIDGVAWLGDRLFFNQNLEWPRTDETGARFPWNSSVTVTDTFNIWQTRTKERVLLATAVQALQILTNQGTTSIHRRLQRDGISGYSESTMRVSESYTYGRPSMFLSAEVITLMREFKGSPRVVRG